MKYSCSLPCPRDLLLARAVGDCGRTDLWRARPALSPPSSVFTCRRRWLLRMSPERQVQSVYRVRMSRACVHPEYTVSIAVDGDRLKLKRLRLGLTGDGFLFLNVSPDVSLQVRRLIVAHTCIKRNLFSRQNVFQASTFRTYILETARKRDL